MKNFLACLFFIFCIGAKAQYFTSPKQVTTGITVAVEIKDNKDLEFIKKNIQKFYGVQFVRINGEVDIEKASAVLELLDDVDDVQLLKFTGDFNDEVIDNLAWVSNITIYLKNGNEDAILSTNNIGYLRKLTLIFEIAPEEFSFLQKFENVKKLHLVAPFVKSDLPKLIGALRNLKNLEDLGLGIDKINDLPIEIRLLKNLKRLTLYDNLSWITEKYLENLGNQRKLIQYSLNDKLGSIEFKYVASDVEFTEYDYRHIHLIYPNATFAPVQIAETKDTAGFTDFATFKTQIPDENLDAKTALYRQLILPELHHSQFFFKGQIKEDRTYFLSSEAVVLVPKNAFEFETGEEVTGQYDLSMYCGLRPSDMANIGVSMFSKDSLLSPKITFNITATCKGQKLKVKEGYFIKIVFLGVADTATGFYAYNTSKHYWENFWDYDYLFDDTKIVPIDFFGFYGNKKTATEVYSNEVVDLDTRFETEGYYYLLNPGVTKLMLETNNGVYCPNPTAKSGQGGTYTLRRGTKLIGIKKEYLDKKQDHDIVKFKIYDKTQALFPELKVFEDYVFEASTLMNVRNFSLQFITGKSYYDVRFTKEGADYYVDLKTENGFWHIQLLQPAEKYGNSKKSKKLQAEFIKRMQKYFAARYEKNQKYLQYLSSTANTNILHAKRQLLYGTVKPKGLTVREFKIRSTGWFSIASHHVAHDSFQMQVKVTDKGGLPVDVQKIGIVHTSPTKIQYYSANLKDDFISISCIPGKLSFIWCIDKNGVVYFLSAEQFKQFQIKNNTMIYLPMNELQRPARTLYDLDKQLGIKNKY